MTRRIDPPRRPLRSSLALVATLWAVGCSPDLRETVGPRLAVPNVRGVVVRDGAPVSDQKVKLERADSTWAEDRTDREGRYEFVVADAGAWELRADSPTPGDFARVSYAFELAGPDEAPEVPPLELSDHGLEPRSPGSGEQEDLPSLFEPLTFRWEQSEPAARVEVRLYTGAGDPFWFSEEITGDQFEWNGLGNQGRYRGRFAQPGVYRWRLIVDGAGSLRMSTSWSEVTFEADDLR